MLVEQLAYRLWHGVINLMQATDNQSQLEVVELVQQHLRDRAKCSHIIFTEEDKLICSHCFSCRKLTAVTRVQNREVDTSRMAAPRGQRVVDLDHLSCWRTVMWSTIIFPMANRATWSNHFHC